MTFEWFIRFKDGQPKTIRVPEDRVECRCWSFFFILKLSFDHEFVPRGQTMNRLFYKRVLIIRLQERIRKKRPDKWRRGTRFLHRDNEPDTFNAVDSRCSADKKISVALPVLLIWPRVLFSRDPNLRLKDNGFKTQRKLKRMERKTLTVSVISSTWWNSSRILSKNGKISGTTAYRREECISKDISLNNEQFLQIDFYNY